MEANHSEIKPHQFIPEVTFLIAILCGIFLRGINLLDQIIIDDEWHMLHKIQDASFFEIFSNFGVSDHCIPITLFYKWIANHFELSEIVIRYPFLHFYCGGKPAKKNTFSSM